MKNSGKILVLAWPDTFVKHSDEWLCKVLPWVGLGTRTAIKAGHAALVLIENKTGACAYYDFGRYITPKGMGRVRGVTTDAELEIPMKAHICEDGIIENLSDILRWLAAHPDKTHGEGRLVASVCDAVSVLWSTPSLHSIAWDSHVTMDKCKGPRYLACIYTVLGNMQFTSMHNLNRSPAQPSETRHSFRFWHDARQGSFADIGALSAMSTYGSCFQKVLTIDGKHYEI